MRTNERSARKEIVQNEPPRKRQVQHEKYFVPLALITFIHPHAARSRAAIYLAGDKPFAFLFLFLCDAASAKRADAVDGRAPTLCEFSAGITFSCLRPLRPLGLAAGVCWRAQFTTAYIRFYNFTL